MHRIRLAFLLTEEETGQEKCRGLSAVELWLQELGQGYSLLCLPAGCSGSSPSLRRPNQFMVLCPPTTSACGHIPSESAGSSCRSCQASVFLPLPGVTDPSSNSATCFYPFFLLAPIFNPSASPVLPCPRGVSLRVFLVHRPDILTKYKIK